MNPHIPFGPAAMPQLYGSVKVGERGQVVIPQEARAEMGLQAGDKLLALGGPVGMQAITFIKAESFSTLLAEIGSRMSSLERLLRMADGEGANTARDAKAASPNAGASSRGAAPDAARRKKGSRA
jgi:AbrB family looped-hinge helix DNA binding protein